MARLSRQTGFSLAVRTQERPCVVSNSTTAGSNRALRARECQAGAENDINIPLRQARAAFEADYIVKEVEQHQGNVPRAGRALGLSRSSLQKKMKEYGLR